MTRLKAATLAVGTEVTDGQINDSNSAWISQKLVFAGIEVIEHRAVPDEKDEIDRALKDLYSRVDFLFVTGGLGPTSDDFTRVRLAETFSRPLVYDPESWQQIETKLKARGVEVREIQKQQCFFPQGAKVLSNPAGTANAFQMEVPHASEPGRSVRIYALPGPPSEIAAVWQLHLESEINSFIPEKDRETLRILRFLGKPESEIAELTENLLGNRGLRIGYRATVPYVEVKIWYPQTQKPTALYSISQLEKALSSFLVNHDQEDVADFLLQRAQHDSVVIEDLATQGTLQERLLKRMREKKWEGAKFNLDLITSFGAQQSSGGRLKASEAGSVSTEIRLEADESANLWRLSMKSGDGTETVLDVAPVHNYKVLTERGRKYITEKALVLISENL